MFSSFLKEKRNIVGSNWHEIEPANIKPVLKSLGVFGTDEETAVYNDILS